MKILVSAYECAPDRGSEAGIGWAWCSHLALSGEQVWVITQAANREAIERRLAERPVPNLHLTYVPTARMPEWVVRRVYGFWYPLYLHWQHRILKEAKRLDREVGFDAVHHVSWGSLQLGSRLWALGKPFFYGPVGGGQIAPEAFRSYFGDEWRIERFRAYIVQRLSGRAFGAGRAIANAHTVFVTNRDTEALVRSLGGSRVQFLWDSAVPDGWLRTSGFDATPEPGPLRLIWVGTLIRRKGILLALDVVTALRGRRDVRLTIIGDGPDRPLLEETIAARGLGDIVTVRGRLPWEQVRDAYDEHPVMLFTSLRESLGMQLFEAMARGCAVVCLDLHGAASLVDDSCGIRVPVTDIAGTVRGLGDAVVALDDDRSRLASLRRGARRTAANLDWSTKVSLARKTYRTANGPAPGEIAVESCTAAE